MGQTSSKAARQQIPTKWLALIVFGLIGYGLIQPVANSQWGWSLPSLATLLGKEEAKSIPSQEAPVQKLDDQRSKSKAPDAEAKQTSNSASKTSGGDRGQAPSSVDASHVAVSSTSVDAALLYGLLKETAPNEYLSPQGLLYTPGSAEGHRLKHLERHLADQPDRPGKHGVFYGDMPQVLRWLDSAYERGLRGAKGTRKSQQDDRTVYEVPFDKPIGYVGGRDGARTGNPDCKKLNLVVEGNVVITAYPY